MKIYSMDMYTKLVAGIMMTPKKLRPRSLKVNDDSLKLTVGFGPMKKTIAEFDSKEEERMWCEAMMNFDPKKYSDKQKKEFIEDASRLGKD